MKKNKTKSFFNKEIIKQNPIYIFIQYEYKYKNLFKLYKSNL